MNEYQYTITVGTKHPIMSNNIDEVHGVLKWDMQDASVKLEYHIKDGMSIEDYRKNGMINHWCMIMDKFV